MYYRRRNTAPEQQRQRQSRAELGLLSWTADDDGAALYDYLYLYASIERNGLLWAISPKRNEFRRCTINTSTRIYKYTRFPSETCLGEWRKNDLKTIPHAILYHTHTWHDTRQQYYLSQRYEISARIAAVHGDM